MPVVAQTAFAVKASFRFASTSSESLGALLTFIGETRLAHICAIARPACVRSAVVDVVVLLSMVNDGSLFL